MTFQQAELHARGRIPLADGFICAGRHNSFAIWAKSGRVNTLCMTRQNAQRISRCCVPQSYGLVGAG